MKTHNTQNFFNASELTKYDLYVGLNDKTTKTQIIQDSDARTIINRVLLAHNIEGATLTSAQGIYTHTSDAKAPIVVIEKTIKIELLFTDDATVYNICEDLKRLLNQESIALQKSTIQGALV